MSLFGRKPGGWDALRRLDKYDLGQNFSARLAQFLRETDERDLVLGNPAQLAAALKVDIRQALRLIALAAHEACFRSCGWCGARTVVHSIRRAATRIWPITRMRL